MSELYRRHVRVVAGYLRTCGIDDPDDVTSDVFVSMVRGLPRFDGDEAAFRSWLMTIAHRRMVDSWRRSSKDQEQPVDQLDRLGVEAVVFDELRSDLLDPVVVSALRGLTVDQREVLALRFLADLSIETVAAVTGRPPGAVKSLQHRALSRLRSSELVLLAEVAGDG